MNITLEFIIEDSNNEIKRALIDSWLVSYEFVFKDELKQIIDNHIGSLVSRDSMIRLKNDLQFYLMFTKETQYSFQNLNFDIEINDFKIVVKIC